MAAVIRILKVAHGSIASKPLESAPIPTTNELLDEAGDTLLDETGEELFEE